MTGARSRYRRADCVGLDIPGKGRVFMAAEYRPSGGQGVAERTIASLAAAAQVQLGDWSTLYPGRAAMGYLCSYVPEEIIHAAGFVPVRVRGTAAPLRRVDAHLQSYTCALCRSTLDQVLGGELGGLSGTIFAHTCDTMQALADLWRINMQSSHFVDTVMQPASLGSPAAESYLSGELIRFRERLGGFAGRTITDDDLRASIALYDESRRLVRSLYEVREPLSSPNFYAILDAAQRMPREEFNPLLTGLLAEVDSAPSRSSGPRLFLVGASLDEPRLLGLIEELGARVVGDDLCTGSRHFQGQVGDGEPIAALTGYYLGRPPCPTKFHPDHDPAQHLVEQVRQAQAGGVVFALEKFCEPHAFDYAAVMPSLNRASLPYLLLEMEQTPSLEALRTRLEAFVEIL